MAIPLTSSKERGWTTFNNLVVTPKVEQIHVDLVDYHVKMEENHTPFTKELVKAYDDSCYYPCIIPACNIRILLSSIERATKSRYLVDLRFKDVYDEKYIRTLHFYRVDTDNFLVCGGNFTPINYAKLRKKNLLPSCLSSKRS